MVEAPPVFENPNFKAIDEYIQQQKEKQLVLERQGDPRFGPAHHPLIPKTKLSKQGNQ